MTQVGPTPNDHSQPIIGAHRRPSELNRSVVFDSETIAHLAKKVIGPEVEYLTALPLTGPRPFTYSMGTREVSWKPARLKQQAEKTEPISTDLANGLYLGYRKKQ